MELKIKHIKIIVGRTGYERRDTQERNMPKLRKSKFEKIDAQASLLDDPHKVESPEQGLEL
jgi:hypothetical protein